MTQHYIRFHIEEALAEALAKRKRQTGQTLKQILEDALHQYLELEQSEVFQTSTINALVEGVYKGDTTIGELKKHGDFGLGTFENLDGEMVVLDGKFFQLRSDGQVYQPPDSMKIPYAEVTFWKPDNIFNLDKKLNYLQLQEYINTIRTSNNTIYAIKIEGEFSYVKTRTVGKQNEKTGLVEAASKQAIFEFQDLEGTLVGFWSPTYLKTLDVPGYHLHFITKDLRGGGHLLECQTEKVVIGIHQTPQLHVSLPKTREFLEAELSEDTTAQLNQIFQTSDRVKP